VEQKINQDKQLIVSKLKILKKSIMKKIVFFMTGAALLFSGALVFNSCSEDPIIPTVNFIAEPNGYEVTITAESTDAKDWAWNYGDGTSSTAAGSHKYTYKESGTYTIAVTVTSSDGNTAIKSVQVTIAASVKEMLTGAPSTNPNGKTWVLDPKYNTGKNGAGPLITGLPITYPFPIDNVLDMLGLGAEYDNEFTFKSDGSLVINNKNGVSLGGALYSYVYLQTGPAPGFEGQQGLCGITYTPKAGGKFEDKQGDLSLDVIIEDPANLAAGWKVGKLNLTNQIYIVPTDYFGFLDKSKTVLVKEITPDKMQVVFLMHGVQEKPELPSTALHVTMIPKK
jgi:PKD repeat protein